MLRPMKTLRFCALVVVVSLAFLYSKAIGCIAFVNAALWSGVAYYRKPSKIQPVIDWARQEYLPPEPPVYKWNTEFLGDVSMSDDGKNWQSLCEHCPLSSKFQDLTFRPRKTP
jgi:hypothetical protein